MNHQQTIWVTRVFFTLNLWNSLTQLMQQLRKHTLSGLAQRDTINSDPINSTQTIAHESESKQKEAVGLDGSL